ncbi:hypothetical protein ACFVH6_02785 [Spirillospora sp. NPDC127200]
MTPSGAGKAVGGMEFGDHPRLTCDDPDEIIALDGVPGASIEEAVR